jgi:hypothetical protein
MKSGSKRPRPWPTIAKPAMKRMACFVVALLLMWSTVPGPWVPGTASALAGEVELLPGWSVSRLRLNAFRNTKMKVLITSLHPSFDPHFKENHLALKAQKTVLPGREITANADGSYSVNYAARKMAFYSRSGKTQAVALINSESFPQKTMLYAYPSGNLKTIALSFSPKDIFIFTGDGELAESSASKTAPIQGRVVSRSYEDDEDELQSSTTGESSHGSRAPRNPGAANPRGDDRLWQQASYQRKVANVGRQLLEANHIQQSISFLVKNTQQEVQASAYTPGGQVTITHELLKYIASDDELAGVLAHELAHVLLNHRVRPQTGIKIRYRGVLFEDQNNINYDELQSQEIAADARGIKLAQKAGFDPWGLHSALQKILSDSDNAALGRSTHPLGSQRLNILAHEILTLEKSPAATMTAVAPTSLFLFKSMPPNSATTITALSPGSPIRLGQWDEASARQEVLKHTQLTDALLQGIANLPVIDPDATLHQNILSGKTSVTDRVLVYREFVPPFADMMKDTQQGSAGYAVLFPQLKAYPFYRMDGRLNSFSVCNQAQYPRTCYTATATDKRLSRLSLEVSEHAGFGFAPQGKLLNVTVDHQTYNAQRQRVSISKRFVR